MTSFIHKSYLRSPGGLIDAGLLRVASVTPGASPCGSEN